MEEFIGKTCPYCKAEIKEGEEIKVCSACGIPHHAGCWEENKGCTTFGCSEQNYEAQGTNPTEVCASCGAPLGDGQAFCPKCGTQKVAPQATCSNCGEPLAEGQEFCGKCGQKVGIELDAGVASSISQFNANIGQTQKKKKTKLVAIIAAALAVVLAVSMFFVFSKSYDDYILEANYEKAYGMVETSEQENIQKENLVAFCSNMCVDSLKDPESFDLREAWVNFGEEYRQIVLKVAANNQYGNTVINYWFYTYDSDDEEYSLMSNFADLDKETYYSWTDYEDKVEIILDNALRARIKTFMGDSTTFVTEESVERVNQLYLDDMLEEVELLEVNK